MEEAEAAADAAAPAGAAGSSGHASCAAPANELAAVPGDGAAAISAFPLTSGFTSKSLILQASGDEGLIVVWLMLVLASAGVVLHAGIKFPWFVFFAKDSGLRPKEPPMNMLLAMDDPAALGPAMSMCLLTTLYGAFFAQVIFSPMAAKLKTYSEKEILTKQMIIEGIMSIQSGDNPRIVEHKLSVFIPPSMRSQSEEAEGE